MIEIDEYRVGFFRRLMIRVFLGCSNGYLMLCIALLKMRREQLARHCAQLRASRDRLLSDQLCVSTEQIVVQINGFPMNSLFAAGLQGSTITSVVVIPGKFVNLLVRYDH